MDSFTRDLLIYVIIACTLVAIPLIVGYNAGSSHFQAECDRIKTLLTNSTIPQNETDYIKMFVHTHCHVEYPQNVTLK